MKIEMGESLVYSWLRHIKECQLVQTNWKVSPNWQVYNKASVELMFHELNNYFSSEAAGVTFKKTTSLDQLLQQGECDVFGVSTKAGISTYYAVDVAFHESGLNYGSKDETILKVVSKCIRTAFCLIIYLNAKEGNIIFTSPKVSPGKKTVLDSCIAKLNQYFTAKGYAFQFSLICNEDFDNLILQPTLFVSKDVADTSELFMRGYQLIELFSKKTPARKKKTATPVAPINTTGPVVYSSVKVGAIARVMLRDILENGSVTAQEIADLQTLSYSKSTFGLNYPLLVKEKDNFDKTRYYANPVTVKGKKYYICSQWYENQRQLLIGWIDSHSFKKQNTP